MYDKTPLTPTEREGFEKLVEAMMEPLIAQMIVAGYMPLCVFAINMEEPMDRTYFNPLFPKDAILKSLENHLESLDKKASPVTSEETSAIFKRIINAKGE
jgi:hypothetical protein